MDKSVPRSSGKWIGQIVSYMIFCATGNNHVYKLIMYIIIDALMLMNSLLFTCIEFSASCLS